MKHLLLTALCLMVVEAFGQRTIIHAGALLNGVDSKQRKEQSVIVEDGKILKIESGVHGRRRRRRIDRSQGVYAHAGSN